MKIFPTISFAIIFGLSTVLNACSTTNPLIGKTLKFIYPADGYEYSSHYLSENQVEWKLLKTPDDRPGKTGTETYSFRELAHKVYLISWSESNGTDVNHIIDLNKDKIFAHVTFKDEQNPDGRRDKSDREGVVIDESYANRGYTGDL
jgi:hypothetical protein